MKEKYQEYALISSKMKEMEERKDCLREQIIESMIESTEEKILTDFGTFSITRTKKWEYPVEILNLEDTYKRAKKISEMDGSAKCEENKSLRFVSIKESTN